MDRRIVLSVLSLLHMGESSLCADEGSQLGGFVAVLPGGWHWYASSQLLVCQSDAVRFRCDVQLNGDRHVRALTKETCNLMRRSYYPDVLKISVTEDLIFTGRERVIYIARKVFEI